MINKIIREINTCIENECYLSALTVALTLPDICGKVEYPNDKPSERYKKWYQEWIGQYEHYPDDESMPYPSADIVYDLRCSLLHEGNPDVNKPKNHLTEFKLGIFDDWMSGGCSSINGENGEFGRTLEIGLKNLCYKLCKLAEVYYSENKDKFAFNYTLVERRFINN